MGYGFFRPTKGKLALFIILTALMFYLPVIPAFVQPIVAPDLMEQASHWGLTSAAESMVMKIGASTQSFGMFQGTSASIMNTLYILVLGYVFACVLLYVVYKLKNV